MAGVFFILAAWCGLLVIAGLLARFIEWFAVSWEAISVLHIPSEYKPASLWEDDLED